LKWQLIAIIRRMADTSHPRVALILCDVLGDEFTALTRSRPHVVHVETLAQGLHNTPALLRSTLQEAITRIEALPLGIEAIVLGYGLCSRGTEGVTTRRAKLVLPRAHDCITLLLGSKERYRDYVRAHPGCYWYSPGWNRCHTPPGPERYDKLKAEYTAKFGPEDAEFLMENEQAWFTQYTLATYVDVGLTDAQRVHEDIQYTQACASWLKWTFDRQQGSPELLIALLDGRWSPAAFLVLAPGQSAALTADERVITAVGLPTGGSVAP